MRFYDYIFDRGGKVEFEKIEKFKQIFESLLKVFEVVYFYEVGVIQLIFKFVEFVQEEKDYVIYQFFQWFVEEQVEEEVSMKVIVDKFKIIGDNFQGFFMFDREFGVRVLKFRVLFIQKGE